MLRQPSEVLVMRREEGCSSTAFDLEQYSENAVWFNPAVRGSAFPEYCSRSAVP